MSLSAVIFFCSLLGLILLDENCRLTVVRCKGDTRIFDRSDCIDDG